ncbi:NAD(P)-binding protein [Ilumatobacter sp.]|uniref:NAD(P)-binding protein n=1 Tax=Ilumatobacter sp. TaxID=1967498 RepID=UPI003B52CA68
MSTEPLPPTAERPVEDPPPGPHRADRRDHRRSDAWVVGAGLGGLAAAALIARAGYRVQVIERRRRPGGRAATDERRGFRFNRGPHALYHGGEAERVLGLLGIAPTGVAPPARGGRMVRGGIVHLAPGGPGSLVRTGLLGPRDKADLARVLARLDRADPHALSATTTQRWIDGLTDRPSVRQVIEAIVRLTSYVDGPGELSADVALSQVQLGFGPGVAYLDRGWGSLIDRLAATPGVRLEAGVAIDRLDDLDARVVGGIGGRTGTPVVVAVGGPAAASQVTGNAFEAGLGADAATLDLGLASPPRHRFVIGVDEPAYLSDHGGPAAMVPPGRSSVSLVGYVPVDGCDGSDGVEDGDDDRSAHDDRSGPAAVREGRARLLAFARHAGITDDQIVERRYLHRMSVVTSIARASTGGMPGRVGTAVPGLCGVHVVGDWVGPSGHLADAVLASAESAAEAVVAHLRDRPVLR